jgi:hypothetical protein
LAVEEHFQGKLDQAIRQPAFVPLPEDFFFQLRLIVLFFPQP